MVFALYGLAAAMVAGGAWLVVQGFELIVLERGWTMVIGGSVLATGGLLLFGIARAVAALHRIEAAVQRGVDRMARGALPDAPPPRPNLSSLAGIPELATPGAAGLGSAALGAATVSAMGGEEAVADPHRARISTPSLPEPPVMAPLVAPVTRDEALGGAPPAPPAAAPSAGVDEFGFAGILRGTQQADSATDAPAITAPSADARPGEGTDAAEESRFAVHFEEPVEPAGETPDEKREPEAVESADKADEAEEMVVIGTYSSGGNSYVMYSDGSIQADTPNGRYNFTSLEELKEFIAAGGEDQIGAGRA